MPKFQRGQSEFVRWMGPLLDCLRALGGSGKPKEVSNWIAVKLGLTPEITEATIKSGANRFHNQVQWARQYLVWEGLLDDKKRGVWELTPLGWKTHIDNDTGRNIFLERARISQSLREQPVSNDLSPVLETVDEVPPEEIPELNLLDTLKALPPYGFELICGRLLREHGFEDVEVTQRSRDGGIDG